MTRRLLAIVLLASTATAAELPRCVDSAQAIAEIQNTQRDNSRTSAKYDGYRKFLIDDTPLLLATRLAYAETLTANCPAQNDRIADLVAAVIGNRIRIRDGEVASVVFQRDQFASSLNIYPESRYRDFLCPRDETLWRDVEKKMRANLDGRSPPLPIPNDTVNYYLYRHSDRFEAPDWKLAEVDGIDETTRACIRAFRNPRWK